MEQVINKTKHEESISIDAEDILYRELNAMLRDLNSKGIQKVKLNNVYGQRYIGTDLSLPMDIEISGTPGNDLGAFMNGQKITVYGNAQDCCGNTMNNGEIVIHGHAGDILGMSARGGKIFVRDDAGYRAGIHMKEYQDKKPVIVIGGTTQDFVGEYMGGGVLIMLGLNLGKEIQHKAKFIGTGMHGGVIYLRGQVEQYQLGKEVGVTQLSEKDHQVVHDNVNEFASYFKLDPDKILEQRFIKLFPRWLRPYGKLYTY